VLDELSGPFTGAFTDGFEDARLGDAVEVVAEGRPPACVDHVEPGHAREPVGLCEPHFQ
jgi:hypothetical protein